ncbi:hypothetical protein [Rhizobium sp. L1K21]|uniref:hypothetical protein n=1 Tax=Rhizobium sp. L1K21 TaxID=2954933 RepID=UPI00209360A9|nr:hypothetical protein [Rhizobium sp. L1K21]MCO6184759.1 hypothetical protein [Rhizobium sp. L1K21]
MKFDDLIAGPCALPEAPLAMPKQKLEEPDAVGLIYFMKRLFAPRVLAQISAKAD